MLIEYARLRHLSGSSAEDNEGVEIVASGGRPAAPKPAPPPAQRRWFQERTSEYPWEQDGLDHVRRLMPNTEPYWAWATFSFTAASGRINECDLLYSAKLATSVP